jgi:hypothetical protein
MSDAVKTVWELPFPSSGSGGAWFKERNGRDCEILIEQCRLLFGGVEALRITYLSSLTVEMINAAYDRVVDLGETAWLRECSTHARPFWEHHGETREFRHLMTCFDDGPCYEFICVSFRAIAPAADEGAG